MNTIAEIKKPLFSVIVPAYNSASFINKCIDSILGQSCADLELLLVDDGSTDNTLDICNTYRQKDERVSVIHKENGGHTSARNEGLKASRGEYIVFVDSDDWLDKKILGMCKDEIEKNRADVVIFDMVNDTDGYKFRVAVEAGYYKIRDSKEQIWDRLLMGRNGKTAFPCSLSAKCFRRETITESQLDIPRNILIGEDGAAFIASMLVAADVSVISSVGYRCLIRSDSVSHSPDKDAFKRLSGLFEYYREKIERSDVDISEQFDRFVVAQLYTATLLVLRSGGGKAELDREMGEILKLEYVDSSLQNAKFSLKGYKLLIKKFILKNRLWWLAKLIDR